MPRVYKHDLAPDPGDKSEKFELYEVFLDLANAFESVPNELLKSAFSFFNIPTPSHT